MSSPPLSVIKFDKETTTSFNFLLLSLPTNILQLLHSFLCVSHLFLLLYLSLSMCLRREIPFLRKVSLSLSCCIHHSLPCINIQLKTSSFFHSLSLSLFRLIFLYVVFLHSFSSLLLPPSIAVTTVTLVRFLFFSSLSFSSSSLFTFVHFSWKNRKERKRETGERERDTYE